MVGSHHSIKQSCADDGGLLVAVQVADLDVLQAPGQLGADLCQAGEVPIPALQDERLDPAQT